MITPPQLVSTGKTQIQSVSVIPSTRRGCNAACRSCIARMTPGEMEARPTLAPLPRIQDLLDYGKRGGAMTAIITSKAEPTLDCRDFRGFFGQILNLCRANMPQVDMHTNGILLCEDESMLPFMVDNGLNMLTLSMADFDLGRNNTFMRIKSQAYDPMKIIAQANKLGILMRLSVLLTQQTICNFERLIDYINFAKQSGVDMIVVRELWRAEETLNDKVSEWCNENLVSSDALYEQICHLAEVAHDNLFEEVRVLPWGTKVFSIKGVNVTFARCDEKCTSGTYKSIQLVPKKYPGDVIGWRINGSWGSEGDVLG